MTKTELLEIIRNGRNARVEFTRDDVHAERLASEVAALLNCDGGRIVLGVGADEASSGLTRSLPEAENWVMNVCSQQMRPAVIPYWEVFPWGNVGAVAVVTLRAYRHEKPYQAKRGSAWLTFVRVGSTSREATREEEARLYQASGMMRYDIKAVSGTTIQDLDLRRLENYLRDVLQQDSPAADDDQSWEETLLNLDLLMRDRGHVMTTVGSLLLFGNNPNRFLPQSGITATAYTADQKDYATVDEELIRGPLVPVVSKRGKLVETGVIDRAVDFVSRNMGTEAWIEGARRRRRKSFPIPAVREAIVNAVAHRDYTITVTDIEVSLYSDRLEVISPGRLPNTVTVPKMMQGYRAARNELLKEILRDYDYVEHRGMGVRRKIIEGMREHNGTKPDLIEEEDRFLVRLWKRPNCRP
jgi:ATP-dependent DNA helicase RecG